jgi:hypothetical protein
MPTMRSDVQTEKSRKYHKNYQKKLKNKNKKIKKKDISSETTRRLYFHFHLF